MRELSRTLGLADEPQDWGIINSDPTRVDEFVRYCETTRLTPSQQFAMGELVFASINDALAGGTADDRTANILEKFLASGLHGLPSHIDYWSSLGDGDEFPIAALLHKFATHA